MAQLEVLLAKSRPLDAEDRGLAVLLGEVDNLMNCPAGLEAQVAEMKYLKQSVNSRSETDPDTYLSGEEEKYIKAALKAQGKAISALIKLVKEDLIDIAIITNYLSNLHSSE